ncbi:hypothetical protein LXL04_019855 [Taraxacum kok-saghyz]
MIESYPMGTSNVKVVNKLVLLKDFSTIDWCGYILHSLRTTKAKWNRDNKLSNYTGPMLVLLLYYVYWTKYESISLRKGHPFIQFVNDKQLLEIETFELMHGGFGKQKFDSPENLGVDVAQNDEELVDKEFADEKVIYRDEDVGVSHHSPAAGAGHHSSVAFETPQPVREEELTFTQVLDQPGVAEEVYAMVDQTEEANESPARLLNWACHPIRDVDDPPNPLLTSPRSITLGLYETCNNLDINPNLRSIGLGKYYMLCFDLKKPSYVLIDHIVRMGTTANRYGPIPLTLIIPDAPHGMLHGRTGGNVGNRAKLLAEAETRNLKNKRKRGGRIG